jgi:hypothetical protein
MASATLTTRMAATTYRQSSISKCLLKTWIFSSAALTAAAAMAHAVDEASVTAVGF